MIPRITVHQITITGHGKIKPAVNLTGDFELSMEDNIRKHSKRWLVEKEIAR
jgi:hypothetical protein